MSAGVSLGGDGWLGGEVGADGVDGIGVVGRGGTDGLVQCLADGTFVPLE